MIQAGRFEAAESALDQWLMVHPGDVETLFLLGIIARRQGRLTEAAVRFRKALDRRPDATRIRLELAGTLFLTRRDEEADYHFRLAIADHHPPRFCRRSPNSARLCARGGAWVSCDLAIAPDSKHKRRPAHRSDRSTWPSFHLDRRRGLGPESA